MENSFEKIGNKLKVAREEAGIPLKRLEYMTKIEERTLNKIENGSFGDFEEVYLKAFLKKIAKAVKLNEEEILKEYFAAKEGVSVEEYETVKEQQLAAKQVVVEEEKQNDPKRFFLYEGYEKNGETAEDERINLVRKYRYHIAAGLALLFVAVIVTVFIIRKPSTEIIREKPYEEVIKENRQTRYSEPDAGQSDSKRDSLKLRITAVDTSWITIVRDKQDTIQFNLFPAQTKEVRGKKMFSIWMGNSSGVELLLNNRNLDFYKAYKTPQRLVITKDGVKEADL